MIPRKKTTLALLLVAVLLAVAALWWTLRPEPLSYPGANVLLISIDTLRADRLGAYGWSRADTTRIDRLAREGIRFEQVVSPLPLTLPSHTSIMTSLYPPAHGVRDNSIFEISPGATTLAEELAELGYECGAFVGAFVLHSRWGLERGFSTYDDRFEYGQPGGLPGQVERRAEDVIGAALPWIKASRDTPFFAWVHLYDPHSPYTAPEPWGSRFADAPYDGEIAYTDAQIGELLDELDSSGLLENTIVVVTADHGEGLGEHDEPGHGMFLYDTTVLVPLIIRLPDQSHAGLEVPEQVRLIDIAPTVVDLVGKPPPEEFAGSSLIPDILGDAEPRPAYAETYYPRLHFGWQELLALRQDGFKYILAPREELYDVGSDPGETRNLVEQRPDLVADLRARVEELRGEAEVSAAALPVEAAERLRALGYIGSAPAELPEGPLPDPKDKIHVFQKVTEGQGMLFEGRLDEAEALLREALEEDERIVSAHLTLGNVLFRKGEYAEAAAAFEATLDLSPDEHLALSNLGLAHRRMGDLEAAQADFEALLLLDPRNSSGHFNLGEMALEAGDPRTALEHFTAAIDNNSELPGPHLGRGAALLQLGQVDPADQELERVASLAPNFLELRYYQALVAEARGDLAAAAELYRTELEHNPRHHRSWFNLSLIHAQNGNHTEAIAALEKVIEIRPDLARAYLQLGREILALEDPARLDEAAEATQRGLALDPPQEILPLGHYVLADIYNRQGRTAEAQRQIELARAAESALRRRSPSL